MDAANASFLLLDLNRPKFKGLKLNSLSRKTNIEHFSDAKFLSASDIEKNFDDSWTNQFLAPFILEIKNKSLAKKVKQKPSPTDAEKQAKPLDKIFNYINIIKCQQLFSLDWYDNTTYPPNKDGSIQLLPDLCCNGSSCKFLDPEYLNQIVFIDTSTVKYQESERERIFVQTSGFIK